MIRMELPKYPKQLPDDCKLNPHVLVVHAESVPQMPACEYDSDLAFEAWWKTHGLFIASWEQNPASIAEAAWSAALEWKEMSSSVGLEDSE